MSTRLSPEAYLDHLRTEGARLSSVARTADLDAPVPTCPGWVLRDLVSHCAEVYAHKRLVLQLGRAASEGERAAARPGDGTAGGSDDALLDHHDAELAGLFTDLERMGPDAQTWTWFPGETSTGFWFRRVAQEALVHRVDGELAAGLDVGPLDAVLATDGVDEVLTWFAGHPGVLAHSASRDGAAGEVMVHAVDHTFVVELPDDGHFVREVDPLDTHLVVDASLRGAPGDLDLHLWGRPSHEAVAEAGDPKVLERLFSRLHLAVSD
jgi:uncharacterized protein (TIGR03083 family)